MGGADAETAGRLGPRAVAVLQQGYADAGGVRRAGTALLDALLRRVRRLPQVGGGPRGGSQVRRDEHAEDLPGGGRETTHGPVGLRPYVIHERHARRQVFLPVRRRWGCVRLRGMSQGGEEHRDTAERLRRVEGMRLLRSVRVERRRIPSWTADRLRESLTHALRMFMGERRTRPGAGTDRGTSPSIFPYYESNSLVWA